MFFNAPSFALGFASGFGTGLLTREVLRIGTVAVRPMAKGMIKAGMLAIDRSREAFAIAGETFEDLVAEARADLATSGTVGEAAPTVAETAATTAGEIEGQAAAAAGGEHKSRRKGQA